MDCRLSCSIFLVVLLVFAATAESHANVPAQVYWHLKLPNTPIPTAIRELLRPDYIDEKTTSLKVGKGGVLVDANKGKPSETTVNVGHGGVHVDAKKGNASGATAEVKQGGVVVNAGHGGVVVDTGHKGNPVTVRVAPGKSPFLYSYVASPDDLRNISNVDIFFLEKSLHPGAKKRLHFFKTSPRSTFLPRRTADAIPFSTVKLSLLLQKYKIESKSREAETMKETLESCEAPPSKGETKLCATSLESMVDFATSKLGNHVKILTTTVEMGKEKEKEKEKEKGKNEFYTISAGVKEMADSKYSTISCHSQAYVYAVYFCHETHGTSTYKVPLAGADGTHVDAVAVCHKDTSAWNPRHLAFQVLNVKPGEAPVCHFLPQDHIVWVPSK